jgi:hypothetical protein
VAREPAPPRRAPVVVSGVARALAATLLVEVPIVVVAYPRQRARLALVAIAANTFTNLVLNVVLPAIPLIRSHHVLYGEAFALIVEALAYAAAARPRAFGRALLVSGISNALSFELGGVVAGLL